MPFKLMLAVSLGESDLNMWEIELAGRFWVRILEEVDANDSISFASREQTTNFLLVKRLFDLKISNCFAYNA